MFLNLLESNRFIALTSLFTILNFAGFIVPARSESILDNEQIAKLFASSSVMNQDSGFSVSSQAWEPMVAQPIILASTFSGQASWYGPGFHGRLTANGEVYNQNALTAAHRTLKFGTKVKVTNLNNGRSVIVRINDRGPFIKGRVIDLSAAAARSINMIQSGVAPVKVTILGR